MMMVNVRRGSFYRTPDGALMVLCVGSFPRRAVMVQGISTSPDGTRFMGRLARTPNVGDELIVRYLPEPPARTGIRFPALTVA
jgi:hypothetical protein